MKRISKTFLILVALFILPSSGYANEIIHHEFKIKLIPEKHYIEVEDKISLPENILSNSGKLTFSLHENLKPVSFSAGTKILPAKVQSTSGKMASGANTEALIPKQYEIILPPDAKSFILKYKGTIHHPLMRQEEDYARSFGETTGLISSEGIYLGESSYWYPNFKDKLLSFTLDVSFPNGWNVISQGNRTAKFYEAQWGQVRWEAPNPQEGIYLIGGKYVEYSQESQAVSAMVFLRQSDEQLANKYLETTLQYINLYNKLIGSYPYKKFALVENFWETGYGMPSFTLLGPKVIRFPFILHSSYPHEILHNWWGNGVFVDYQAGNWCEGLTSYLADHLIREQRGKGAEYRRTALQHYTDFVRENKDFPLTEFRGRHSSVTQAVGYGKAMMFFHMLRKILGDHTFVKVLQEFYQKNKFQHASFDDWLTTFNKISGKDFTTEFNQWLKHPGAPELSIEKVDYRKEGEQYLLTALLIQKQSGPAYKLQVPVAVYLKDQEKPFRKSLSMTGKQLEIKLQFSSPPLRLDIDPDFDLFRRLDRNEIPPALSQAFGSENVLIILPGETTEKMKESYRMLGKTWQNNKFGKIEIKYDNELKVLPGDRTIWLFGWENKFRQAMEGFLDNYEVSFNKPHITIGKSKIERKNHSFVLTARNPANQEMAVVLLVTDNKNALPGLGRKLPHYRKYSYLAFDGDEPSILLKGQWPTVNSPMSVLIDQEGINIKKQPARETALAYPLPVFSEKRMMNTIKFLSDINLKGRGFGTPELDRVADFIAESFKKAGLLPAGDKEGSYFQEWKERGGEPEREVLLKNVIGILPGGKWENESVVIGAHYDHLGFGWPENKKEDKGKIHPGADDNASGIAVLLELARQHGKKWKPDRTVVFVAFAGEEANLRGSRHYVRHEKRFPVKKCLAMLNIDTVGRLKAKKLMVLGTGTAREWMHIFMGTGYVTGVPLEQIADDFGSSDQKSFIDAKVPAVQFFSGPHTDYHRPGDTADKIDSAGLVKTASVIQETIKYLAFRDRPMNSTLNAPKGTHIQQHKKRKGRKVSFGTIPDFTYTGKGYRITGVSPNSPAEKAGLKKDDVIVRINTNNVDDLRSFSQLLKTLQPGDSIMVTYIRNGSEQNIRTKLVER